MGRRNKNRADNTNVKYLELQEYRHKMSILRKEAYTTERKVVILVLFILLGMLIITPVLIIYKNHKNKNNNNQSSLTNNISANSENDPIKQVVNESISNTASNILTDIDTCNYTAIGKTIDKIHNLGATLTVPN